MIEIWGWGGICLKYFIIPIVYSKSLADLKYHLLCSLPIFLYRFVKIPFLVVPSIIALPPSLNLIWLCIHAAFHYARVHIRSYARRTLLDHSIFTMPPAGSTSMCVRTPHNVHVYARRKLTTILLNTNLSVGGINAFIQFFR